MTAAAVMGGGSWGTAYAKVLADGAAKARERAAKMGLSTAQANGLVSQLQP